APPRLIKTPAAGHPLPLGEGYYSPSVAAPTRCIGGFLPTTFCLLPTSLSIVLAHEIAKAVVGTFQRVQIREKNNSEVLRSRSLAEAAAVHYEHVFFPQQLCGELIIAIRNLDSGEGVERSARRHATHAGNAVAPFDGQVAPGAQLALDLGKVILRALQRRTHGVLLRMVRAKPRPQQLMNS